ncbi:response regulator [Brevibacillus porteri]|uniref:response regulator n=1 Tax=Brevibacillus porteri TaxID=2126350 RepID=UPI003D22F87C
MYKLILVDDEEDVREGVSQEIDWHSHGYEVVAKAENGREALELVERLRPDVVVTDIKMPFMNGLQLAESIGREYPAIRIIILTGFDEFEYAQKAVKLQIDEYVLKPFSASELMEALDKVKRRMDEEAAHRENVQLLRDSYQKSLPVLREVFLSSLLSRQLIQHDVFSKACEYGIELRSPEYLVAVICVDQPKQEEQQLFLFAVKNIAEEQLNAGKQAGIVFLHEDQVVLLMRTKADDTQRIEVRTQNIAEEIRRTIEKYMSITVTIGIGNVVTDVAALPYSYEDAMQALDYKSILGCNRMIVINDVEKQASEQIRLDERREHELVRCIKMGTSAELRNVIDELFDQVARVPVSIEDYRIYLLEIMTTILKTAHRAEVDMDQLFGGQRYLLQVMTTFTSMEDAREQIVEICERIMASIASGRQTTYRRLITQALDYTHTHYHSPDISIHKVCDHLHISLGYFSGIFKKEMKTTFVSYLLSLRMEKAKELLRTTDLKSFEIAEKVGYTDPNYFSFSFRKYAGMSAKEYRSQSEQEG